MSETIKQLIPYLDKIAIKLDMGAQRMWELQMQQVKVSIITEMLYWVMVVGLAYGVYKSIKMYDLNDSKNSDEKVNELFFVIMGFTCGAIGLTVLIIQIVDLKTLITAIFNPEYTALKNLLILVK